MEPENDLQIILIFKEVRPPFVTPFFAKEYQGCERMQRNNGAGGSRTHVQTPANIFVYNHRLCIVLTVPRHITQA